MGEKISKGLVVVIVLLVIAIISILCSIYYVYNTKSQADRRIAELEKELSTLKTENNNYKTAIDKVSDAISNVTNTSTSDETMIDNSEEEEEEKENEEANSGKVIARTTSDGKWNGDITTIDFSNLLKNGKQYEEINASSTTNRYAQLITDKNGKVFVAVKDLEGILRNTSAEDLGYSNFSKVDGYSEKVELKGISDVEIAYFGTFGQDYSEESPILFLMQDGTIKYDSFINVVKNQLSPKSVAKLSDIAQIYSSSFGDVSNGERMGGALTSLAVDKDGIAYDLSDYITIK